MMMGETIHWVNPHINTIMAEYRAQQEKFMKSAPLQPGEILETAMVEYYSKTNDCWIPCWIEKVDAETGAVKVDCQKYIIPLEEQHRKLRNRTRPTAEQLSWVRRVLDGGCAEMEAKPIFARHATRSAGGRMVLGPERFHSAGLELDSKLGVSGTVVNLKRFFSSLEKPRDPSGLTQQCFCEAVQDFLWEVQQDYAQALWDKKPFGQSKNDPGKVYEFDKHLGKGSFGTVQLARSRRSGELFAIKMMKMDHKHRQPNEAEVERLLSLDHPHIVKVYEHYEDSNYMYLVMDYCSGGELRGLLRAYSEKQMRIPEHIVANIMGQVMLAIAHVHARGIVHLDLKGANIMLSKKRSTLPPGRDASGYTLEDVHESPHVMVIDLGVAQTFHPGTFFNGDWCGTPTTMAPEVWSGEIHPKADIFSCGVVMFELLTGHLPFDVPYRHCPTEPRRYWTKKQRSPKWSLMDGRSDDAVGLTHDMLNTKRSSRPSAAQCLETNFLIDFDKDDMHGCAYASVPKPILHSLIHTPYKGLLYKSVALQIAQAWPSNQLPTMKSIFLDLDDAKQGPTGRVKIKRLKEMLTQGGYSQRDCQHAADHVDMNRDGVVTWTEFVAACINLEDRTFDEAIRKVFDEADADDDGRLYMRDIRGLLMGEHVRYSEESLRDAWQELVGSNARQGSYLQDSFVDWRAFRQHFRIQERVTFHPSAGRKLFLDPPCARFLDPPGARAAAAQQERQGRSATPHREQPSRWCDAGGYPAAPRQQPGRSATPTPRQAPAAPRQEPQRKPSKGILKNWGKRLGFAKAPEEARRITPRGTTPALERELQKLHAMGFTNRQLCLEVLLRNGSKVNDDVVMELQAYMAC